MEWLSKHVRLKLFRLQELQFEPIIAPGVLPEELKTLPVLNIHIPKGAGIDLKAVDCACQEALRFWNYEKAVFFCHSWLLSPALKKLLPPETRIVQFGAKFHLLELDEECRQAEETFLEKYWIILLTIRHRPLCKRKHRNILYPERRSQVLMAILCQSNIKSLGAKVF